MANRDRRRRVDDDTIEIDDWDELERELERTEKELREAMRIGRGDIREIERELEKTERALHRVRALRFERPEVSKEEVQELRERVRQIPEKAEKARMKTERIEQEERLRAEIQKGLQEESFLGTILDSFSGSFASWSISWPIPLLLMVIMIIIGLIARNVISAITSEAGWPLFAYFATVALVAPHIGQAFGRFARNAWARAMRVHVVQGIGSIPAAAVIGISGIRIALLALIPLAYMNRTVHQALEPIGSISIISIIITIIVFLIIVFSIISLLTAPLLGPLLAIMLLILFGFILLSFILGLLFLALSLLPWVIAGIISIAVLIPIALMQVVATPAYIFGGRRWGDAIMVEGIATLLRFYQSIIQAILQLVTVWTLPIFIALIILSPFIVGWLIYHIAGFLGTFLLDAFKLLDNVLIIVLLPIVDWALATFYVAIGVIVAAGAASVIPQVRPVTTRIMVHAMEVAIASIIAWAMIPAYSAIAGALGA